MDLLEYDRRDLELFSALFVELRQSKEHRGWGVVILEVRHSAGVVQREHVALVQLVHEGPVYREKRERVGQGDLLRPDRQRKVVHVAVSQTRCGLNLDRSLYSRLFVFPDQSTRLEIQTLLVLEGLPYVVLDFELVQLLLDLVAIDDRQLCSLQYGSGFGILGYGICLQRPDLLGIDPADEVC